MFSLGQLARLIPTLKPAQLARFRVMSDLWDRDGMREQFFEGDGSGRVKTGLLPDELMGSGPPGRKITTYEELLNLFVSVERAKTDGVSISDPAARNPKEVRAPKPMKPSRPSRLPRKPRDAIDTRDPTDSILDPFHPIGFSQAAGRRFSTIGV